MRGHKLRAFKINFIGSILNILILPCGVGLFLYLFAQRLDGKNDISLFTLLIPVWIIFLPIFAYAILNGLAAQNTRVNKFEKAALSFLVPLGSTISLILIIWELNSKKEKEITDLGMEFKKSKNMKLYLLPHCFSMVCLYLFMRCLIKPA